jgi:NAD(P)H dehydrogenase (quinone)
MGNKTTKILVLFYSLTGAVAELAKYVAEGAEKAVGVKVTIKRVPELLPESFFAGKTELKKLHADLSKQYPLATKEDLIEADGIAFGTPTHFGSFAAQLKEFLDQLSGEWLKGKLVNKPAAVFCAAGSTHGGEELTLLSMMIPLLNLGMIPVGIPYPIQGEGAGFDAGSPYGAIYVTGGGRKLSEDDKKVARILGVRLATMAQILNCGCETCNLCHDLNKKID